MVRNGVRCKDSWHSCIIFYQFTKFTSAILWMDTAMLVNSIITGLPHWSQGSYGIVTITLKSMVACAFFYKYRRLLPLVISHAMYDGIQVGMLLLTYPQ